MKNLWRRKGELTKMKKKLNKSKVVIIVLLILAGVSLNATVGENGIITKAQNASTSQKFSNYKEQLQMNLI